MKLILCSEGFFTDNTVQACVQLCGKPQNKISVAIINEGYAVESGPKYWVLDNLNDVAKNFTGGIDIINLLALPLEEVEARILACDVLFMVGGNTDYLMHVFEKTGFDKLLPKILETTIYVGSSAGSMVVGHRLLNHVFTKIYGDRGDRGVQDYLGIVDLAFIAHLNSTHTPNNRAEILSGLAVDETFPVYALKDDSAIVVNDGQQSVIGSQPLKIVDGKIV